MSGYGRYRLIDLFAGCGGMSQGFVDTKRFLPIFANDFNAYALESYRENFDPKPGHSIGGDIVHLLKTKADLIPRADVVVGGPPCQGFSLLNKKRLGDPRRQLWYQFMQVVDLCGTKIIVMENVRQLLTSPEFVQIEAVLHDFGFHHVDSKVLCAANYGVPEMRFRTIIMASKVGPISLPRPTHFDPKKIPALLSQSDFFGKRTLRSWRTVSEAIRDLPQPVGTEIRDTPPTFGSTVR